MSNRYASPFPETRVAWLLLAASALGLELAALWFQHGMGLDPCVMCIYERLALIGIVLAGLLGAIQPRWPVMRLLGYLLWGVSAAWGLKLGVEHIGMQNDKMAALSCSFSPDFPAWARLDEWFPSLFLPTGYCDDVQWQWLSLTMVEWVTVAFGVYLSVLAIVVVSELRGRRRAGTNGRHPAV
ncbi:MAG: disulfide bond formation protein DsbB [Gammaproteobacteria bacterium]|nr:disulfide bond formation protein DsbB [Gammaproteobacteria bacterium]